MQLTVDLSALSPAARSGIIKGLAHADKARHDLGVLDQVRLKRIYDAAGIGSYKAELGPPQMVLSMDQWHRAMQKYGQLCFMDPDFVPWLLKKNEDMRVKQVGTKVQVGYGN